VKVVRVLPGHIARIIASASCICLLAAGCATAPPASDQAAVAAFNKANDPYEPFNRAMLDFNLALDKAILKPVAYVYKESVPDPLQTNVTNFLANLRGPVIFANDLLQGEFDRAGITLLRFAMNSTIGILGINDFAGEAGITGHTEDFGQTLATWDVDDGPYLVLPIFGPSNPRDGVGIVADNLIDPLSWLTPFEFRIGRTVGNAVDRRARNYDQINDLEKNSLDFYAAIRSLYRQRRVDQIRNGAPASSTPIPGIISVVPQKTDGQQSEATTTKK
jgi:phospholipid-binding lipoprotein MlaA